MTDSTYTAIQVVMDRSGSMYAIQGDAEGALRSFIKDQGAEPGKATIRLVEFDTVYDLVYPSTDIHDAPNYHLSPRGGTALNDAIGRTIVDFGNELAAMDEDQRPGHVIFVIITDGLENSSKEFNIQTVKSLVEAQQQQWNWNFVFLAANQDAVLTGQGYGFQRGQTMTFNTNTASVTATGQSLGRYAAATRSGGTYDFTDDDRAAATQED
jgi:uncharacterized protein YegL